MLPQGLVGGKLILPCRNRVRMELVLLLVLGCSRFRIPLLGLDQNLLQLVASGQVKGLRLWRRLEVRNLALARSSETRHTPVPRSPMIPACSEVTIGTSLVSDSSHRK